MRKFILIIDGSNKRRLFELRRVSYKIEGKDLHFDTGRGKPEIFNAVCEDAEQKEFSKWLEVKLLRFLEDAKAGALSISKESLAKEFKDRKETAWTPEGTAGFLAAAEGAAGGDFPS